MVLTDGTWTFEDARQHLDNLVQKARDEGPQLVDLGGEDGVVVMSRQRYAALTAQRQERPLIEFLESLDLDSLDLSRENDRGRDIILR